MTGSVDALNSWRKNRGMTMSGGWPGWQDVGLIHRIPRIPRIARALARVGIALVLPPC